jgi:hypothetical protein
MNEPMMTNIEWLRAAVQAEEEYGGDIQIGGKLPVKKPVDPIKLKEQLDRVRLYSLLFGELKRLLHEVDFGCGAEAAYSEGRQRVVERMQSLTLEQDAALKQLLADSAMLAPSQLHSQLRQQLHSLLNLSDWQLITAAAVSAVESELLRQVTSV